MINALYIGPSTSNMTAVRAPVSMTENFQDLDAPSTTRTASGKMVRHVVRGGSSAVRSIELEWQNIPASEVRTIMSLISTTYFYLKYADVYTGALRTEQFYAGDRKVSIKRYGDDQEGSDITIGSFTVNFIEV